jgi:hypothetical protein
MPVQLCLCEMVLPLELTESKAGVPASIYHMATYHHSLVHGSRSFECGCCSARVEEALDEESSYSGEQRTRPEVMLKLVTNPERLEG